MRHAMVPWLVQYCGLSLFFLHVAAAVCFQENQTYIDVPATARIPNGWYQKGPEECQIKCQKTSWCDHFLWRAKSDLSRGFLANGCWLLNGAGTVKDVNSSAVGRSVHGPKNCPASGSVAATVAPTIFRANATSSTVRQEQQQEQRQQTQEQDSFLGGLGTLLHNDGPLGSFAKKIHGLMGDHAVGWWAAVALTLIACLWWTAFLCGRLCCRSGARKEKDVRSIAVAESKEMTPENSGLLDKVPNGNSEEKIQLDSMEPRALQEEDFGISRGTPGCGQPSCRLETQGDGQISDIIHNNQIRPLHNEHSGISEPASGLPAGASAAQMAMLAQEGFPLELATGAPLMVQAQVLSRSSSPEAVPPTPQKGCPGVWEPSVQQQLVQALLPVPSAGLVGAGPSETLICQGRPFMPNMAVQAIPVPISPAGGSIHYQQPQEQIATHYQQTQVTPGASIGPYYKHPQEQIPVHHHQQQEPVAGPGPCATVFPPVHEAQAGAGYRIRPLDRNRVN